jgi:hypothetical protein
VLQDKIHSVYPKENISLKRNIVGVLRFTWYSRWPSHQGSASRHCEEENEKKNEAGRDEAHWPSITLNGDNNFSEFEVHITVSLGAPSNSLGYLAMTE